MISAGYSGTQLWKKLGFKPCMKLCVLNPPAQYGDLLADGPGDRLRVTATKAAIIVCLALHMPPGTKHDVKEGSILVRIATMAGPRRIARHGLG